MLMFWWLLPMLARHDQDSQQPQWVVVVFWIVIMVAFVWGIVLLSKAFGG
jgi:hypothetical protein